MGKLKEVSMVFTENGFEYVRDEVAVSTIPIKNLQLVSEIRSDASQNEIDSIVLPNFADEVIST